MLYDPDSVTWFYTEDREVKPWETISGAIQAETPMDGCGGLLQRSGRGGGHPHAA